MENLPSYIAIAFGLTTFLTVYLFYKASKYSTITLIVLLGWLFLQAVLGLQLFYTVTDAIPPRFVFLLAPTLVVMIGLFASPKGRQYLDSLDTKTLTLLHIVRIPVELVLFQLFVYKTVPELMTFEGRNFDILSGLTAPIVYYFGYVKNMIGKKKDPSVEFSLPWTVVQYCDKCRFICATSIPTVCVRPA